MKKKIMVTGGAGFIGSHLCERLLAEGHEVIAVDSYFTGDRQNVEHLFHNPLFRLVRHDITFPYFEEVDCIYNLACPAAPIFYTHDPVMTLKSSLIGSFNVLEVAKRTRARIVHASSAEVYGQIQSNPVAEGYSGNVNPIGEHSAYVEGKRAAESIFTAYHHQYGVDTRIARLFNIYGPRMLLNDGKVLSDFLRNALSGENITIRGDGTQTGCFLYIDDAIEALVRLMERDENLWQPINIGSTETIRIDTLAEDIMHLTDSTSKTVHIHMGTGYMQSIVPDIRLARQQLQWEPLVPLEEGLIRTIKYLRETLRPDKKILPCLSWAELM